MSIDPTLLRVMQAKGVDVDTILSVIEADHAKAEAVKAERRAEAAAKKRAYRASLKSEKSARLEGTHEDIQGQPRTESSPTKEGLHTSKKTNPIQPSLRSGERSAREALWVRFWAAFPKRPGNPKQPAEEKFYRLLTAGVDGETMIAGAERYAAARAGQDPQFTCTAVVFLNQGRWKDDHTPPTVLPFDRPASRASPGRPPPSDSIDAGLNLLSKIRASREQASRPSPDWDGPEIIASPAALPSR